MAAEQGWNREDDKKHTLIDPEIETLYEGFNKKRPDDFAASLDGYKNSTDKREAEGRAAKLRNEDVVA